jgi:phosphohistidine phosphatase SixA
VANRVEIRPTAKSRKKRRQRRALTLLAYIVVVFGLAWFFELRLPTTIIFVRHADVDEQMSQTVDQPLNAAGLARADALADFLEFVDVDGGPNAIYVSEARRTQQTAEPLARRLGIEPEIADPYDVVGFTETVLFEHKREIVVVVTHRDVIVPLVEELHGHQGIGEIAADDYDEVIFVVIPWFGKVKTYSLPYGVETPPRLVISDEAD